MLSALDELTESLPIDEAHWTLAADDGDGGASSALAWRDAVGHAAHHVSARRGHLFDADGEFDDGSIDRLLHADTVNQDGIDGAPETTDDQFSG